MIIGLGGLFGVVVAYVNRDELKGQPRGRELAMYVASVAAGVGVIALTSHGTDACGADTNCGVHPQPPSQIP